MMGTANQLHHGIVCIKLDDVDGSVFLLEAENIGHWNSQEMAQNDTVDAAMRQDHDGFVRVSGNDFFKFRNHPLLELKKGFSSFNRKRFDVFELAIELTGIFLVDLLNAQSFPLPE